MSRNVILMTRKQARIWRKIVNSLHVTEAEVQNLHVDDQDQGVTPNHVLEEKIDSNVGGVESVARREVPGIEVPKMMQKNQSTTTVEDVMGMMAIVIVVLLMVLKGKANCLLQTDKEMQTMNQMMMAMNQSWLEMRTMHLKVMKVAPMVTIRTCVHNVNTKQLID